MVRHGAIVVMGRAVSGPAAILRGGNGFNDRQRGGHDFQLVFGVSGGHHISPFDGVGLLPYYSSLTVKRLIVKLYFEIYAIYFSSVQLQCFVYFSEHV
jgi:hypothetical protein